MINGKTINTINLSNIAQTGYILFADGLQICWVRRASSSVNNTWTTVTFPRAFTSTPVVLRTTECVDTANGWLGSLLGIVKSVSKTNCSIFVNNTTYSKADYILAIGKG